MHISNEKSSLKLFLPSLFHPLLSNDLVRNLQVFTDISINDHQLEQKVHDSQGRVKVESTLPLIAADGFPPFCWVAPFALGHNSFCRLALSQWRQSLKSYLSLLIGSPPSTSKVPPFSCFRRLSILLRCRGGENDRGIGRWPPATPKMQAGEKKKEKKL